MPARSTNGVAAREKYCARAGIFPRIPSADLAKFQVAAGYASDLLSSPRGRSRCRAVGGRPDVRLANRDDRLTVRAGPAREAVDPRPMLEHAGRHHRCGAALRAQDLTGHKRRIGVMPPPSSRCRAFRPIATLISTVIAVSSSLDGWRLARLGGKTRPSADCLYVERPVWDASRELQRATRSPSCCVDGSAVILDKKPTLIAWQRSSAPTSSSEGLAAISVSTTTRSSSNDWNAPPNAMGRLPPQSFVARCACG